MSAFCSWNLATKRMTLPLNAVLIWMEVKSRWTNLKTYSNLQHALTEVDSAPGEKQTVVA